MIETGFEFNQYMWNRVLLMQVKCGMMVDVHFLFDEMPQRNEVSWNIMISGLVDSGRYVEAFHTFLLMWGSEDSDDAGTRIFTPVICSSAGLELASSGRQLHSCVLKLGLSHDVHVSCALIDMYCKCGCIEEAWWVFAEMPEKTVVGWSTIISGYALNGYSEEALEVYYEMRDCGTTKMDQFTYSIIFRIFSRLASLESVRQTHGSLVRNGFGADMVASNSLIDFYGKWGRMDYARNVSDNMPLKNVISWNALIEIKRQPYMFEFNDREIDRAMELVRKCGHVTPREKLNSLFPDDKLGGGGGEWDEERVKRIYHYHSEKLAAALGLISTSKSASLQVVQRHRMCWDCHKVIKLFALITGRDITVRDSSRFHHFKDGDCSCGDYW